MSADIKNVLVKYWPHITFFLTLAYAAGNFTTVLKSDTKNIDSHVCEDKAFEDSVNHRFLKEEGFHAATTQALQDLNKEVKSMHDDAREYMKNHK